MKLSGTSASGTQTLKGACTWKECGWSSSKIITGDPECTRRARYPQAFRAWAVRWQTASRCGPNVAFSEDSSTACDPTSDIYASPRASPHIVVCDRQVTRLFQNDRRLYRIWGQRSVGTRGTTQNSFEVFSYHSCFSLGYRLMN